MKEVIIKYNDSRILRLLKSLSVYLDFSISEESESSADPKKPATTTATDFVNKWGGFLKDTNTDRAKQDYLANKYK